MNRRDVLRATGAGTAVGLAGCSSIPFLGSSCGPGEQKIGQLAKEVGGGGGGNESGGGGGNESGGSGDSVDKIKGAIESAKKKEVIISDGTGKAALTTLGGGFRMQNINSGDCVFATGIPLPTDRSDIDIEFLVKNVGVAE